MRSHLPIVVSWHAEVFKWRSIRFVLLVAIVFSSLFIDPLAHASERQAGVSAPAVVVQVQKDMLVVGSEQDYPPFATGMTDATAGGFTVELWKAVADEAGLNYTIRVLPFHQLLQEFKDGKIDVLINLAHSEERHRFADFTVPHVVVHGAVFVRKGESNIRTEDDLAGKSIIVLNADLGHDYALSKSWGKQLVPVDTTAEGFQLLASGKYDAMLLSKLAGMQTLQTLKITNVEAIKAKAGFSQKFAFAVHEGQSELLDRINEGMALTKSNGTYNTLYEKWFGIYETKEVGLRDLLKYFIPTILIFLCIGGYFLYRRQIERQEWEEKLLTLYTAIEQSPISIVITDADANIEYANPRFSEATGYSTQEARGQNPRILQSGLTPKETYLKLWETITKGQVWHGELVNKRKNGEIYWEEAHISPVTNAAGELTHYVAAKVDVTQRKRNENALRQSEERFRFMLENSPIAVRISNMTTCQVVFANQRYAELINVAPDKVLGINPKQYYANPQDYADVIKRIGEGERVTNKLIKLVIDGDASKIKWVLASYLKLEFQNEPAVLGWFYDISDRKAVEEQVQHLAHYDPLTDLPNRTLFADRLQQALAAAKRDRAHLALMFIDLDKFKPINDTLGHNIGDLLLQEVAHRIQACLRESDTVARVGGDEFVVLLPEIDTEQDALGVAEKIRYVLNQPFDVQGHLLGISSSTGIVIYPEHGNEDDLLMKNADTAMYHAKAAGRDNVKFYHSGMQEMSA